MRRHLLTMLREQGEMTKGPPPFAKKDRSQFLQALDQAVIALAGEIPKLEGRARGMDGCIERLQSSNK